MTFKQLLKKIFLVDLFAGLAITGPYTFTKAYTEQYPKKRPSIAPRFHGAPRLNRDPETGETLCIACNLCAMACPIKLIEVQRERDPATKKFTLLGFTYNVSRCMYCNLCAEACPTNALELTQIYEYATYNICELYWDQKMLEKGPQIIQYKK
jgi:NADH-quinone oxidoreductase subunit I